MNLFYEFSTGARARTWRGTLRSRDGESGATRSPAGPRPARSPRVAPWPGRGPPRAHKRLAARTRVVMASTLLQRCFIHTPLTPPPHDVSLFMLYLSARARGASPRRGARFPVRRSRAGPLFYPHPCLWSTPRTDKPGPAFVFDAVKTPNQVNSIHKQHDTRKWETPL